MAVFECADVDEYVFGARRGSDEAVGFLLVPVRYLSLGTHGGFGPLILWSLVYMGGRSCTSRSGLKFGNLEYLTKGQVDKSGYDVVLRGNTIVNNTCYI
jgi:hypothetical protein